MDEKDLPHDVAMEMLVEIFTQGSWGERDNGSVWIDDSYRFSEAAMEWLRSLRG